MTLTTGRKPCTPRLHSSAVTREAPPEGGKGTVWVCLPTYDEAANLAPMVENLLAVFDGHGVDGHILVIDDNSPDGTGDIADRLAAQHERVEVLHRATREGLGPAYRAGFRVVLDRGANLIIEMDCDFSHDPASVPALVQASAHADVVLGSRYIRGGGTENWGVVRRAISRGGCVYARATLGIAPRDLTGGFKCFRREVLEAIPLDEVGGAGYVFQVETTYRAILLGYRVVEVPILFRDRAHGRSKMSRGIVLEAAVHVPRLRWALRHERREASLR
jgi:dolichol-phosphate mannosyltransferase